MENLEEKILGILNDPQAMEQVLSAAKSLGLSPDDASDTPPAAPLPVMELLQKAGAPDHRQEALMHALVPYLKPQRRKKLERALRLAKLSHLAGFALQSDPAAVGDL